MNYDYITEKQLNILADDLQTYIEVSGETSAKRVAAAARDLAADEMGLRIRWTACLRAATLALAMWEETKLAVRRALTKEIGNANAEDVS